MSSSNNFSLCSLCSGKCPNGDMIWIDGALHRQALGRHGALGEFYDARTDTLTKLSMLSTEAPSCVVRSLALESEDSSGFVQLQHFGPGEESCGHQLDTLRKLKVDEDMKLSVMLGFVEPEGCAKYLMEMNPSSHCSCALAFATVTEEETLLLNHDELRGLIVPGMFKTSNATHVVVRIKWGEFGLLAFENKNVKESDKADMKLGMDYVAGELEGALDIALCRKSSPSDFPVLSKSMKKISVRLIGDFGSSRRVGRAPVDLPSAMEFARKFWAHQEFYSEDQRNNKKGRPLEFTLLSVDSLARIYNIDGLKSCVMKSVSPSISSEWQEELADREKERRAFYSLQDRMLKSANKYTPAKFARVVYALAEAEKAELELRNDARKYLLDARSGKDVDNNMITQISAFRSKHYRIKRAKDIEAR